MDDVGPAAAQWRVNNIRYIGSELLKEKPRNSGADDDAGESAYSPRTNSAVGIQSMAVESACADDEKSLDKDKDAMMPMWVLPTSLQGDRGASRCPPFDELDDDEVAEQGRLLMSWHDADAARRSALSAVIWKQSFNARECKVIQSACLRSELALKAVVEAWLSERDGRVLKRLACGNYSLQTVLRAAPATLARELALRLTESALVLARNAKGCRVLQRCLERPDLSQVAAMFLDIFIQNDLWELSKHHVGNYVVQTLLMRRDDATRDRVLHSIVTPESVECRIVAASIAADEQGAEMNLSALSLGSAQHRSCYLTLRRLVESSLENCEALRLRLRAVGATDEYVQWLCRQR